MKNLFLKTFTQLLVLAMLASCGGGSGDEVPSLLTPPDQVAPTISSITPTADATYLYGDNINFSITFSEPVTVSGVPSLTLNIDGSNFNLPFSSGSGTATLVFDKNLDMERSDIDGIDFTAIQLNGGSIKDIGGNNAVLTITPTNYPGVLVESIRPVLTSVEFNSGETYTTNTAATINSVAMNADEMIISTASDCSVGTFIAYNSAHPYTLSANSINNVYFQLSNFAGNKSACTAISITHDNQAPGTPVITQTGDATTSQTDTANWTAVTDSGPAGILRYEYAVSTTMDEVGIIAGAGWTDIGTVLTYQVNTGVTLATATNYYTLVKAIDNALNESIGVSPAWQILTLPVVNSLDINGGALYTNDVNVTINIDVTDADEMIVSTASDCSTGTWEAYAISKAYVLTTSNALNNVYMQFRNSSGGNSTCNALSITHDDQAPNSPVLSLTGDGSDIASDTTSWVGVTDNGPSGILRYEFAISTTNDELGIIPGGAWTDIALASSYQITSGISLATATDYYSLVKVIDNALNEVIVASAAWQITIPPNPISNLEYSDRTKESISLGWAQPVDNGIPVTDYEIEYKGNGVTTWTLLVDGVSTNTSYVHTGLAAETLYEYRVRAYNGASYSAWSNTLAVETLPDLPFFEPGYKAINVGGSTTNSIVSFADLNDIYLNGVLLTTLNKSDTYVFTSTDFDVVEGTQPFFVAGRAGSTAGGASSGNFTWVTQAWVGKEYFFNLTRNGPLKVKIFAFEDTTVTIYNGATVAAGPQFISADTGFTFTLGTNASYRLASTGYVGGYVYANQGGNYYDPRPLIPSSTDVIGFPSNSANFSSGTSGNAFSFITSDGSTGSGTLTAGTTYNTNQDAASLYSGNALRFMSTDPITGISTADSNGLCAAPFMPVAMFKTKYGINTDSDWIAFASDRPVTVTQTLPNGTTSTFALTRTGSGANRPYRYYISANQLAGTLYEGDDKFQMWYEPESTAGGAIEDETVMFGWD